MNELEFDHKGQTLKVLHRIEGEHHIAEVVSADGVFTGFHVDATTERLSDMNSAGHDDPIASLMEQARDAFISRNP